MYCWRWRYTLFVSFSSIGRLEWYTIRYEGNWKSKTLFLVQLICTKNYFLVQWKEKWWRFSYKAGKKETMSEFLIWIFLCTSIDKTLQNVFFWKLNFHSCVPPSTKFSFFFNFLAIFTASTAFGVTLCFAHYSRTWSSYTRLGIIIHRDKRMRWAELNFLKKMKFKTAKPAKRLNVRQKLKGLKFSNGIEPSGTFDWANEKVHLVLPVIVRSTESFHCGICWSVQPVAYV